MTQISKALHQVLTDWYAWAQAGAPEHDVFISKFGLCKCVQMILGDVAFMELDCLLGGTVYPFGIEDYLDRKIDETMHLCPKRLEWVRNAITNYEVA